MARGGSHVTMRRQAKPIRSARCLIPFRGILGNAKPHPGTGSRSSVAWGREHGKGAGWRAQGSFLGDRRALCVDPDGGDPGGCLAELLELCTRDDAFGSGHWKLSGADLFWGTFLLGRICLLPCASQSSAPSPHPPGTQSPGLFT